MRQAARSCLPWNQKNLDYEIETNTQHLSVHRSQWLEIKRTSITRLKPCSLSVYHRLLLSLEIKRTSITRLKRFMKLNAYGASMGLEIKRTSITRLKLMRFLRSLNSFISLKSKEPRLRDWNLEVMALSLAISIKLEIKRTSITRLKPVGDIPATPNKNDILEIKRTSITRLKPSTTELIAICAILEIKRTSITRLKHLRDACLQT